MGNIYDEYFFISKHEKMREKVFFTRMTLSVIFIFVILIAIAVTAYAYFSSNVVSSGNVVSAAGYELEIEVDGNALTDHILNAEAGKTYSVEINYKGPAETGFCILSVYGGEAYHTQQIGIDKTVTPNAERKTMSFKIICKAAAVIEFTAHWGTSKFYDEFKSIDFDSEYYIKNKEEVEISVSAVQSAVLMSAPQGNTDAAGNIDQDLSVIDNEYTVRAGDTLSVIAALYNTTVEKLQVYNNISDPNVIQVGQLIKIPPAEWEIPLDETTAAYIEKETVAVGGTAGETAGGAETMLNTPEDTAVMTSETTGVFEILSAESPETTSADIMTAIPGETATETTE